MRIRFDFEAPGGKMEIPTSYNYFLQAMIYNSLSDKLSVFLHNQGFEYEKRSFKMFTFSRLFGKYRIHKLSSGQCNIVFYSSFYFYLSSPFDQILQEFANKMVSGTPVNLNGNRLFISSVQVLMPPVFDKEPTSIKMLSPVSIRSTHENEDADTPKTHYYSPMEKEFSELIRLNLLKKFLAFSKRLSDFEDLEIKPLHFSEKKNFALVTYKGFIIKGYTGVYELSGNRELKQFAWDCGLGERNSQGFGMFDIWKPNEGFKYE
jgi:CRISPR-associated endoribonuclease Cas6